MFENCESLISLPDISNWNMNNNITNKNKLFRNCKSLENLPNLSNLFSEKELKKIYIFEGCTKLETKAKRSNEEKNKTFLERLPKMCDKFSSFPDKVNNCLQFGCKWGYIIFCILFVLYLLYFLFIHLINSFYLDKSKEYFNDSKEYVSLLKYTNISHIAKVRNITNSSELKEIDENKEDFIKKK